MWTSASVGTKYALKLVGNLTLARMLPPEAFGLAAIVYAVISGVEAFTDAGTRPSLLRSDRTDDVWLDTAWTLQVIRGALVAIIVALISWPMARFFGDSRLQAMIAMTGVITLLYSLNSLEVILAIRTLQLKMVSISEVIAAILGYIVMIAWAWVSPTAWSLLLGGLVSTGAFTVLSYTVFPHRRHKFRLDRSALSELIGFGKWVSLSTALGFLILQGDRLAVGKLISIETLGIYFIAVTWASALQQLIGMFLSRLYLPLVSEFRRKSGDYSSETQRLRKLILVSLVVPFAFAAGTSHVLIEALYPSNYISAGPLMQILVVGAWLSVLEGLYIDELLAAGQPQIRVYGQLCSVIVLAVPLLWVARGYGVMGIAVLFVIATAMRALIMGIAFNRGRYKRAVPDIACTLGFLLASFGVYLLSDWLAGFMASIWVLLLCFLALSPFGAVLLGLSLREAGRLAPHG